MGWVWAAIFAAVVAFSSFSDDSNTPVPPRSYYDYGNTVQYTSDEYYDVDYGNPYDDGSGHSAGYEWAEENDVDSCDGNSQSFIEGCEEYLEQRDAQEVDEYYDEEYNN